MFEDSECFTDLVERTETVKRKTYCARLFGKRLQDCLTNPPICIRNEFKPACFVKSFCSSY